MDLAWNAQPRVACADLIWVDGPDRARGRKMLKIIKKLRLRGLARHPEVRAKRASKGDGLGASAASFEGRFAATSG
jgi:hypothetical protein